MALRLGSLVVNRTCKAIGNKRKEVDQVTYIWLLVISMYMYFLNALLDQHKT